MLNEVISQELKSLLGDRTVDRRSFVVSSLGAGFALAVLPVTAQTITTSTDGLVAGEVKVRGAHVMAGYYKSPEATREVLDENGWLKTGDLGLLDDDGFLFLRGRSKTMFLGPAGQNIYPEEIEARLNALPLVGESLVVEREHRLHALVYPDFEAADAARVGHDAIEREMERNRQKLNAALPPFCQVSAIEVVPEEFQKTPTRKIKRFLYAGRNG